MNEWRNKSLSLTEGYSSIAFIARDRPDIAVDPEQLKRERKKKHDFKFPVYVIESLWLFELQLSCMDKLMATVCLNYKRLFFSYPWHLEGQIWLFLEQ